MCLPFHHEDIFPPMRLFWCGFFFCFPISKHETVLPAHKSQTYSDGFVIRHLSRGPLLYNRSGINYNIFEERYQTYWTPLVRCTEGGTRTLTAVTDQGILSPSWLPLHHLGICFTKIMNISDKVIKKPQTF